MLIRLLSVDEVIWCRQQSVNHQGLLCSLHCATTVVLREQLNFKSAVIRSSCWKLLDMLFCLTLYKMLASLVLYGVIFVSQL